MFESFAHNLHRFVIQNLNINSIQVHNGHGGGGRDKKTGAGGLLVAVARHALNQGGEEIERERKACEKLIAGLERGNG